jgi:hypothetical protein
MFQFKFFPKNMIKTFVQKLFVTFAVLIATASFVLAQETTSTVSNPPAQATIQTENDLIQNLGDFSLQLPNATWRAASKAANSSSNNVDFIFGDRLDGLLQVRKITIDNGGLAEAIDREQNQKLQFLPSFVNGKEENFKGNLSGKVVNYEFTQSGKPMTGRAYFFQADNKTLYILRFTGLRDKLKNIRNQTDLIARTFKLKS